MTDSRFKALKSDPRYRIPNQKKSRTTVDSRFKRLFADRDFRQKASVDRYGRHVESRPPNKDLSAKFLLEHDNEEERRGGERAEKHREDVSAKFDSKLSDEDVEGIIPLKGSARRDYAREGGFSDSSSDEASDTEDSEVEVELAAGTTGREEVEDIPMGEVSRRLAAVNLDWDNIRAADIMAVAISFAPKNSGVDRVSVYPSEFGRERIEREAIEGPPKDIFAPVKPNIDIQNGHKNTTVRANDHAHDSESDDENIRQHLLKEQTGVAADFDTTKLRKYQLERLRYYYAVITCDTKNTAKVLYDAMDGREYLSSANFFDLRFIPDETSFEHDKAHETCDQLLAGYKPNDFTTEVLTHSKVRLTWDDDDTMRKEVQKRAFSRAELNDEDIKAYLGSDVSDAESNTSRKFASEDLRGKKQALHREQMRAALGLSSQPAKVLNLGNSEPVGDMQVTFTSGLNGRKSGKGVFENEPQDDESTRARYIRKEKERKQRRKERAKLEREPHPALNKTEGGYQGSITGEQSGDKGFDDPFFRDPSVSVMESSNPRKHLKKHAELPLQDDQTPELEARKADLALLMTSDAMAANTDELRHFDMREIRKAENKARKEGKSWKQKVRSANRSKETSMDEFQIETQDPRFTKLFESHEFAIDPTDRLFQGTRGMRETLEIGRRKRTLALDGEESEVRDSSRRSKKIRRARV